MYYMSTPLKIIHDANQNHVGDELILFGETTSIETIRWSFVRFVLIIGVTEDLL